MVWNEGSLPEWALDRVAIRKEALEGNWRE